MTAGLKELTVYYQNGHNGQLASAVAHARM